MHPDETQMPFGDHLEELRTRVVWALLGPVPIAVAAFIFGDQILEFLIQPAEEQLRAAGQASRLLATGPAEVFIAYLKLSFVVAALAASPWILYQLWLFVAPGLYRSERKFVYLLIPSSAFLTVVGAVFLYTIMLPVMLGFLIRFSSGVATSSTPT